MPPPQRTAWQRRPGETGRAWECFNTYLRLGPSRTLSQTARTQGSRLDTVKRWSSHNQWSLRAAAYDEHMQAVYAEAAEDTTRDMAERHVKLANLAQAVVARELAWLSNVQQMRDRAIAAAAQAGDPPPDWALARRMSVGDAAKLMLVATNLERGAVTGPTYDDDLAGLDPQQIREELAAELNIPVSQLPELPG